MQYEDGIKLMDHLNNIGYRQDYIVRVLMNCEEGRGIGHSMHLAETQLRKELCKTDTLK